MHDNRVQYNALQYIGVDKNSYVLNGCPAAETPYVDIGGGASIYIYIYIYIRICLGRLLGLYMYMYIIYVYMYALGICSTSVYMLYDMI